LPHGHLQVVKPLDLQASELADGFSRLGFQGIGDDAVDGAPVRIAKLDGYLVVGQAGCPELDSPGTSSRGKGPVAVLTTE
jgi:hypothetical protein